jgi:hypothetical protein
MAEQDRAPMIQLPIDQEVYMDSIHEGTVVEDATVATEIVSFERVGDAYVLEGAVVFAGYVSGGQAEDSSEAAEEDRHVDHIHQRLPFILRVPIRAQKRGILNVKSRLSGWKLSVAGLGWLRVQGDLQVAGLSSDEGYHFECGGQQLGHPMFEMQFRGAQEDDSAPVAEPDKPVEDALAANQDLAEPAEDSGLFRSARTPDDALHSVEMMSEARGGHGLDENKDGTLQEMDGEPETSQIRAIDELAKFDRYFAEETKEVKETRAYEIAEQNPGTVAEFEFEHQLSPEEMIQFEETPPAPKAMDETFVASRSFLDEGFHAAAGFARPRQPAELNHAAREDTLPVMSGDVESEEEVRNEQTTPGDSLWSFVDFNAPERKRTLRYIIVMEEETLETVAERLHCTKSELVRVNKMEVESIEPGQILLVPEVPFTFTK